MATLPGTDTGLKKPKDFGDMDWSKPIEPRLIRRSGVSSRQQRAREVKLIRIGQPKPKP